MSQYRATTIAAESPAMRKRENRKIRYENEMLKANKHAPEGGSNLVSID
jgi:hypothetical protein